MQLVIVSNVVVGRPGRAHVLLILLLYLHLMSRILCLWLDSGGCRGPVLRSRCLLGLNLQLLLLLLIDESLGQIGLLFQRSCV